MHTNEEWRPVVGYEGRYEVSSLGRVRSWVTRQNKRRDEPHVMAETRMPDGYLVVQFKVFGKKHTPHIHRLVAAAFHGPRPGGREIHVCHNDGDRTNNAADNLRYGTIQENVADQIRHGTHWSVAQRARTHCQRGHEFTPDNIYWQLNTKNGNRVRTCETCNKARRRRRAERERAAREQAA